MEININLDYQTLILRKIIESMTNYEKRIRSVPGNNVLPVKSSAIIHPTDHISTKKHNTYIYYTIMYFKIFEKKEKKE